MNSNILSYKFKKIDYKISKSDFYILIDMIKLFYKNNINENILFIIEDYSYTTEFTPEITYSIFD